MTQPTQQQPAGVGARWRGHTHKELYLLLHDGPGAGASAEPSRRWAEISTSLSEIGQDLQKALEQASTQWAGKAAGRAYDRLSTTAAWATETSTGAAAMRTAVENQGDHIAKARADMPAPEDVPATQPDPATAPAAQIAAAQADLEAAEAAAASAEERAFEVMAAYELNTNTTTASMASFEAPPELIRREGMHHGGGVGHHETRPSGFTGAQHHHPQEDRRPWWHQGGHRGGDRWQPPTSGSSAPWVRNETVRPVTGPSPAAPAASGGFSGAALNPLTGSDDERRRRSANRSANGGAPANGGSVGANANANPGGGSPATGPRASVTGLGLPHDMQAAAASQAAATAQHAGAPIAPAGGAPLGGQQDKMAMRRFGMEAIGSSQWFGDADDPVVGQSPRRRRDFHETDEVTESVSVLDEEHKLPPTVIGDGHAGR